LPSIGGADGIIFDANGNLLVGSQGASVFQYTGTGAPITAKNSGVSASYHLTLDPNGDKVYTSPFGGPLSVMPLTPGLQDGTAHAILGDDRGVTQIAFAGNGNVFYVNGQPNGGGNVGLIDLNTYTTTQLFAGLTPAHGMVYDPFTGLMTMFGAGQVGTIDQLGGGLKTHATGVCDFDQGAVDGYGHALIAGCNGITFIDYSATGDITSAANFQIYTGGFANIDDVAPLVGPGSAPTPEPGSFVLLGAGLVGLILGRRRLSS